MQLFSACAHLQTWMLETSRWGQDKDVRCSRLFGPSGADFMSLSLSGLPLKVLLWASSDLHATVGSAWSG